MADKLLLQINNLSKAFGEKIILDNAKLSIGEKQKIGVIGRNGAGKSTLFKMILEQIEPDNGEILKMPHLQLGYIEQNDPFLEGETVMEFLHRYTGKPEWECAKVASQFQFKNEKLQHKVSSFSGGYQMRIKLAATLLFEPNLLLLDEPTNFLDLSTLILLENFLKNFRGTFMVITHDREFIKRTTDITVEVANGQIYYHPEPLEEYLEFKEEQKRLADSVNKNIEIKQKQLQTFVDRFGAKASMAKSAQSKMKVIEKLDSKKINIGHNLSSVKMYIPVIQNKVGTALEVENLSIGYPTKTIAEKINLTFERGQKIAILGDNGQGKTTFLKTLVGEIPPLAGNIIWKAGLKIAYYHQHIQEGLSPEQTILQTLTESSQGNTSSDEILRVLGNFLFKKTDYDKPIKVLSGGEKARLCLAQLILTKPDVFLLDEPTNHLDFETVESLGEALGKFAGTVFVISHDRTFVNLIATQIVEVKNGNVRRVLGTYEDYVWLLEEETRLNFNSVENQTPTANSASTSSSTQGAKPSKENARKIYELKKELGKIERKMLNLKNDIEANIEVQTNTQKLSEVEAKWLETTTEIESLS